MGYKFTIYVWVKNEFDSYEYVEHWSGNNPFVALYQLYLAKNTGAGCIKLEWRP